jgi:anti-sigma regulatory factor (Ser/Thr protein kinase)
MVLAVCEIATNALQYGGGSGEASVWSEDGAFVCEIRSAGSIPDPLVGRLRPPAGQGRGYGVWIANQLCDLVQIRSGEHGTTVRVHMTTR